MNGSASTHLLNTEQVVIQEAEDSNRVSINLRGLRLVSLPRDSFAHATSLKRVDLSFNSLTILPSSLFDLGNIRELHLCRNALQNLSSENLKKAELLEVLDVSHNCLRSLPECLGSMQHLKMVNCSGNNLRFLEASNVSAPNLSVFRAIRNPIKNVPPDVYLEGLAALREYFSITMPIPDVNGISQLACGSEPSKTFRERLLEIKLRRTKKREKLKEISVVGPKHFEEGKYPQQFKELVRTESAGQVQTSDYGSINSSNQNVNLDFWEECNKQTASDSEGSSCHGDHGSDERGRISGCSDISDWSKDSWDELGRPNFEDNAEEVDCILPDRTRFLKKENVAVLIPEHNRMKRMRSEFHLDVINERRLYPKLKKSWIMAGPVVSVGPDGTEFYGDRPAFIRLPLRVKLGNGRIRCFCSNTSVYEKPSWTEMLPSEFKVCDKYVVIRTFHLSFYTILLDLSPISVSTVVTPKEGGTLVVDKVPGVRVTFPPGSVKETIKATVKVISGDLDERLRTNLNEEDAIATPVVVLSPHGYLFQEGETNPVHVHLPVPNYLTITQKFGPLAKLSLWQSRTSEDDPVSWQKLQEEPRICQNDDDEYFVDISVSHFSLLTGLWEGIKNQIGLSYQGGAQSMKCQAWMLESKESNSFGLVVICHNAEKSIQDVGNYAINVGGSLKPVSVVPGGDIVVKLSRSEYFEPDTSADQDETLEKVHSDFKGEEFEMQFACRFKGNAKPTNKDIFGKVLVKKRDSNQNMFAFNLIKKDEGEEDEAADPWAITSLRELADVHNILVNNNWRRLARSLGYTVSEMSKFEKLAEPFVELVAVFRRRRGSYEDFMESFWKVARDIKLNPSVAPEPEETASSQWRSYFNLGGWFSSLGSTGNSSRASSSRGASEEEDENQPSTSALNANRKRPMHHQQRHNSGSAAGSTTSSSKRRRNHLGPPAQPNEEQLLQQLRISPQQPTQPPYQHPTQPPYQHHSSPSGSHGSSPPGSWTSQMRHTPPHISTAQGCQSTNLVQSSGFTPLMSARGAGPSRPPSQVQENYASTSRNLNPKNLDDEMQRSNTTEITQAQLYRIAPLIQAHWYKLARLIRNDENVESDIKVLRQQYDGADEQATQMLLQWREKCPDCCNRGMLYGALVDLNLKTVAKKCEEIYQRSRRPNPS